ncbi:MAG: hypothetical protein ACRET8_11310 [Burkholderiales bacterium]
METENFLEPSGMHDSERVRNWIPLIVPLTAAVFVSLIFIGVGSVL